MNTLSIRKFFGVALATVLLGSVMIATVPGFALAQSNSSSISNIKLNSLTNSSTNVTWQTSMPTSSFIWYRQANSSGMTLTPPTQSEAMARTATSLSTSHTVQLTGLTAGTRYAFIVGGLDSSNNFVSSGEYTFSTSNSGTVVVPPANDGMGSKPIIYNTTVMPSYNNKTVTIEWNTSENTDTYVRYSKYADFRSARKVTKSGNDTKNHSVRIKNLDRNTYYYFRIKSSDSANNMSIDDGAFYLLK